MSSLIPLSLSINIDLRDRAVPCRCFFGIEGLYSPTIVIDQPKCKNTAENCRGKAGCPAYVCTASHIYPRAYGLACTLVRQVPCPAHSRIYRLGASPSQFAVGMFGARLGLLAYPLLCSALLFPSGARREYFIASVSMLVRK